MRFASWRVFTLPIGAFSLCQLARFHFVSWRVFTLPVGIATETSATRRRPPHWYNALPARCCGLPDDDHHPRADIDAIVLLDDAVLPSGVLRTANERERVEVRRRGRPPDDLRRMSARAELQRDRRVVGEGNLAASLRAIQAERPRVLREVERRAVREPDVREVRRGTS